MFHSLIWSWVEHNLSFTSIFRLLHTCTDTHTTPTCPAYVLLKLVQARVPGENEMQMVSQLMLSIFGNCVQESKFGRKARFPKHTCKQSSGVSLLNSALQKSPGPFVYVFSVWQPFNATRPASWVALLWLSNPVKGNDLRSYAFWCVWSFSPFEERPSQSCFKTAEWGSFHAGVMLWG